MSKKTTIYDIAKKLNITAATVSRALNNNPRISEDTRILVKETAKQLNYQPNRLALALKSGQSMNVGVVLPYINRNFFSNVIRGIEEELNPKGYNVIICQTHEDEAKEMKTIQHLLDAQVDGVLISISRTTRTTKHFEKVLAKNVPLVFFDRKMLMEGVSSVTLNDFQGAYDATKHLIDQGCKRIAHLTVDTSLEIYKNRLLGYRQALEDHDIKFDEQYVEELKSDIEGGKSATAKLMKLAIPPDAIFSSSDLGALGVIQYIRKAGLKLPSQFCVVGFSNEPFTQFMELPITSVDQSPILMGKSAAKVFLEQIGDNSLKIQKHMVLSPELKIRKSSTKLQSDVNLDQ